MRYNANDYQNQIKYTSKTVCSDEELTLDKSAKHHIPQATNIPYQPLLIKPIYTSNKTSLTDRLQNTQEYNTITCIQKVWQLKVVIFLIFTIYTVH